MSVSLIPSNEVLLKFSMICMTYFVFFRYKITRRHFCLCGERSFPFLLPKGNYKIVKDLSNAYQSAQLSFSISSFIEHRSHSQNKVCVLGWVCFLPFLLLLVVVGFFLFGFFCLLLFCFFFFPEIFFWEKIIKYHTFSNAKYMSI